ncbi:MarP family serine protease [Streptomyces sp. XM4193]|uniref:MarP family serine protease n=1 Tax=Streptomyces sp. XM4193 TaxID=2929782 RepID=UPI001FF7A59E|nr:MarP family serine protease [Streptomyces sp. XM4193]MCK1797150.1 MarP family serine protease [Streptomyces sp. XM4193]
MNLLDVVLLLAVVASAVSGYRRGLVAGAVSLAGFVGGAVIGVWLLPHTLELVERGTGLALVVALATVLVPAALGQGLAARLGWKLRESLHWVAPARWLDGVGGALANALAVLIVAWVAASALVSSPTPELNQAIRGSSVLGAVDDRLPEQAPTWFSRATGALATAGFPQVFNPFERESVAEVPEPSGDNVTAAARTAAQRSTVKVEGVAEVDGRRQGQEGSGFVYADKRVMTNAHVVAGVSDPTVQIGGVGRRYEAQVVHFDADVDVAVLRVPELSAPVLRFADDAGRGDGAVVAGYPENGGLDLRAATVAGRTQARGQDIYGSSVVTRDIHPLRGNVRPGNSGGPLLTPGGQVYGVIFARSVSNPETGYALTADQVRSAASRGDAATEPVDTGSRSAL